MKNQNQRLKVGPNEARLFQRKIRPYPYLVQLSSDWAAPVLADPLDAAEVVSLAGGGETARYQPEELANPNGLLSLQRVTLNLGPEVAQTSDGVAVEVRATIEFYLEEKKAWLVKLLKDGTLRSLGQTFADRARSAIISKLGEVHYGTAIGNQSSVGTRVEHQLAASVGGSPFESDGKLGVRIISTKLRIDRHEQVRTGEVETPRQTADFDLPNKARRIVRFLREEKPTPDELTWVAARLDGLVALEKARLMSNGRATVVMAEGIANPVANAGLSDFLDLDGREQGEGRIVLPPPEVLTDPPEEAEPEAEELLPAGDSAQLARRGVLLPPDLT